MFRLLCLAEKSPRQRASKPRPCSSLTSPYRFSIRGGKELVASSIIPRVANSDPPLSSSHCPPMPSPGTPSPPPAHVGCSCRVPSHCQRQTLCPRLCGPGGARVEARAVEVTTQDGTSEFISVNNILSFSSGRLGTSHSQPNFFFLPFSDKQCGSRFMGNILSQESESRRDVFEGICKIACS